MILRRKRWLTTALVALSLGVALAACGGSNTGKTAAQSKNVFFPIISP